MMADMVGALICFLLVLPSARLQEEAQHRNFQYNSAVDPSTGRYNFAYDTGHDNDIAHSLHMQYQDADGIVRGRYGYTDPRGKLRMVEYEAGPNGFVARGDVGPDQFPHGQTPEAPVSANVQPDLQSYREPSGNDFDLDPAPIQMSGWDPAEDPLTQAQPDSGVVSQGQGTGFRSVESEGLRVGGSSEPDMRQFTTLNVTNEDPLAVYGPELGFYSDRYPRVVYTLGDSSSGGESLPESTDVPPSGPGQDNNALTVNNIDVDLDDIREAGNPARQSTDDQDQVRSVVRRSGTTQQETGYQPVRVRTSTSYSYSPRYTHDHDAEVRSRYTHDHDAEKRSRYTHDHDAEMRSRLSHDHYVEGRRYRYTHDHEAEKYRTAAERAAYYRRYYGRYNYPRRIFYRDSHSMEPHEHHDNPVYRNYRDHQHSDVHLYGRYRNYDYPATAKPYQMKYIPSDKYHDKIYYSTYSS